MKSKWLFLLMAVVIGVGFNSIVIPTKEVSAANSTYYVDSENGSDSNPGTSSGSAWKTLDKVNAMTFGPGDHILFKAGGIWNGQFYLNGSGEDGNPILIDSYGTGGKPIFNGGGVLNGTVYLKNSQYVELNNLEITNTASTLDYRIGIYVQCEDIGVCNHIYVQNMYVHDVHSFNGNNNSTNFYGTYTGGILFKVTGSTTPTKFNDVIINNNSLSYTDRNGIFFNGTNNLYKSTNIRVTNNVVDHPYGGGYIVEYADRPYVGNNVTGNASWNANWYEVGFMTWGTDDAVVENNEAYLTHTIMDGMGFDSDGLSNRAVYQYNYSHDNEGGFMLICSSVDAASDGTIVRYNISQNDKNAVFWDTGNNTHKSVIYNNTVYIGSGLNTKVVDRASAQTSFYNNLIYNAGSSTGGWGSAIYDTNAFYGFSTTPTDAHKITSNPLLVNPGSGGIGRNTVDGYKLQASSPLINAGRSIPGIGSGAQDYWGNVVPYGSSLDIGAHEYGSTVNAPTPPAPPTPIADDSGNGNSAKQIYNTSIVPGVDGGALSLDGYSYLEADYSASLDIMSEITMEAWIFKPSAAPNAFLRIIDKSIGGTTNGYMVDVTNTDKLRFIGGGTTFVGNTVIPRDQWVHIAATYVGGATKQVKLYVNGNLDATGTGTSDLVSTTQKLHIGSDNHLGSLWVGKIDDARIYNRALSQTEIQSDKKGVYSTSGLQGYYSFGPSAITVSDNSGNGNSGVEANSVTNVPGVYGGGIQLDGSSYVEANNSASLNITSAITLEAWIYKPSTAPSAYLRIIDKSIGGTPNGYSVDLTNTDKLRFIGGGTTFVGNTVIPRDQWVHIAATYVGGATKQVKLYVNGNLDATGTGTSDLVSTTQKLHIGADNLLGSLWVGTIDEARIYNRALSQTEIQSDKNGVYSTSGLQLFYSF